MPQLPTVGGDSGSWGQKLNDFLSVEHDSTTGALLKSSLITGAQQTSEKGQPNGYAPLDNNGKVPSANLPAATVTPDAATAVKGVTRLSVAPAVATTPIAVGDNDPRMSDSRTPSNNSVTNSSIADAAIAPAKITGVAETTSHKGAASGYAPLDGNAKVPVANIPGVGLPNVQTGDYVPALTDSDGVVEFTAAATLTVPTNATVAFPIGTVIEVYCRSTTATIITGASGVSIEPAAATLAGQYATARLRKRATDTWVLVGQLA